MPTVQSFGSWKTGGPAADSGDLTANRRKRAEYMDYLNAQSNILAPATPTAYGPAATWVGPVPFGSTALTLGYAGGGPIRKTFNLRVVLENSRKDRKAFCNACNDAINAFTR
jgi:hypothetical protein